MPYPRYLIKRALNRFMQKQANLRELKRDGYVSITLAIEAAATIIRLAIHIWKWYYLVLHPNLSKCDAATDR